MTGPRRTGLLVSVRSVVEAEAALTGGADLIDVKEPSRGSLGRADDAVLAAVVRFVHGRALVSAALGELPTDEPSGPPAGFDFVKWGLAGWGSRKERWQQCLLGWMERFALAQRRPTEPSVGEQVTSRCVAVAYADWQRAQAPHPATICEFACRQALGAFLIDTCVKDGTTLLDWLSLSEIGAWCSACRAAAVPTALAGSLGPREIAVLRPLQPAWFAVRGAVCRDGRAGTVDGAKVRALAALLAEPITVAHSACQPNALPRPLG